MELRVVRFLRDEILQGGNGFVGPAHRSIGVGQVGGYILVFRILLLGFFQHLDRFFRHVGNTVILGQPYIGFGLRILLGLHEFFHGGCCTFGIVVHVVNL